MKDLINKFNNEYGSNPDNWNWDYISDSQTLSEDFIREFKDKVNWGHISIYQKLSEDFIREFKDKVNMRKLLQNEYCPLNIKIEYIRENVTKEDPSKHSIEQIEGKKDTSLDELKKLVGI